MMKFDFCYDLNTYFLKRKCKFIFSYNGNEKRGAVRVRRRIMGDPNMTKVTMTCMHEHVTSNFITLYAN